MHKFDLSQVYNLSLKERIIYLIHYTVKYLKEAQDKDVSIFNLNSVISGDKDLTLKSLYENYFIVNICNNHIRIHNSNDNRIFRFTEYQEGSYHYCKFNPAFGIPGDSIYFEEDTNQDNDINLITNSIFSDSMFRQLENLSLSFTIDLYQDIILKYYPDTKIIIE